jgi:hypothetical protein
MSKSKKSNCMGLCLHGISFMKSVLVCNIDFIAYCSPVVLNAFHFSSWNYFILQLYCIGWSVWAGQSVILTFEWKAVMFKAGFCPIDLHACKRIFSVLWARYPEQVLLLAKNFLAFIHMYFHTQLTTMVQINSTTTNIRKIRWI